MTVAQALSRVIETATGNHDEKTFNQALTELIKARKHRQNQQRKMKP